VKHITLSSGSLGLAAAVVIAILPACGISCRGSKNRSDAPRVLLIGIDGADFGIIDRLIAEGSLPTFARLEKEGAFGPLRSQEPLLSPIVWTTIATGRRAQDHGVLDFVEVGPDGQATPITSARRKVPALWNIAGDYGKSSGFIGWYASFPAEKVDGFEVSDRLAFHQVRSARATEGATYPESLLSEIRRDVGEAVPDVAATRRRFMENPDAPVDADGQKRLQELSKIYATSEFYRRLVPVLERQYHPDILGVYFEGIDACGHLFMEDAPPRRTDVNETDYAAFSTTVDRYYRYQDEVLSDLLRLEGPDTVTMIVSDHGFKSGNLRPRISGRADTGLAPLWHRLYGVLFLHGRPIRPRRIAGASVFDVTPTALALLGIPLSKQFVGRPLEAAFLPGVIPAHPAVVASYPPLPKRRAPPTPPDSEAVQKLVALGYLTGSTRTIPHDPGGRTATSYLNEGMARSQSGDIEGALHAYGRVLELDPGNLNALVAAASIYIKRRELDRAKELLGRAAAIDPKSDWVLLQEAAWSLQSGRDSEAGQELAEAEKIDDRIPSLYLLKGRLANAEGDARTALEDLDRAEHLTDHDDLLAEILVFRAEVEAELGNFAGSEAALDRAARYCRPEQMLGARGDLAFARRDGQTAESFFRKAIAANPDSSDLERKLGETLGALKSFPESEAAFRRAIAKARSDPERESAYGDLSLLFERQGREDLVLETLRKGLTAIPNSYALWGMLGAAYGRQGEYDKAIEAYERTVSIKPTPMGCKTLAALLFEERHDRRRAIELWQESLRLDPRQKDVRLFLEKYGRGIVSPAH
jgi:tetratricopeptide (TPR) repeat protein